MDRGVWWATVHGAAKVRHNLVTKLPPTTTDSLNIQISNSAYCYTFFGYKQLIAL